MTKKFGIWSNIRSYSSLKNNFFHKHLTAHPTAWLFTINQYARKNYLLIPKNIASYVSKWMCLLCDKHHQMSTEIGNYESSIQLTQNFTHTKENWNRKWLKIFRICWYLHISHWSCLWRPKHMHAKSIRYVE